MANEKANLRGWLFHFVPTKTCLSSTADFKKVYFASHIQVPYAQRIGLDEGTARFDFVTHQGGENLVG
jgi:hypothetical protein